MEVSKFIIDGNDVYVKDAEGRNLIAGLSDDVTTAQNTADNAQNAAQAARSAADDALNGLIGKQNALIKGGYTGNIDELKGSNDLNGVYFINTATVTGSAPPVTGFYYMLVFGALQVAFQYTSTSTGSTTVTYRIYANSAWSVWRSASFAV